MTSMAESANAEEQNVKNGMQRPRGMNRRTWSRGCRHLRGREHRVSREETRSQNTGHLHCRRASAFASARDDGARAWALCNYCLRADPAGSLETAAEKQILTVTVSAVRGREGAVLAFQPGSRGVSTDARRIVRVGRMGGGWSGGDGGTAGQPGLRGEGHAGERGDGRGATTVGVVKLARDKSDMNGGVVGIIRGSGLARIASHTRSPHKLRSVYYPATCRCSTHAK